MSEYFSASGVASLLKNKVHSPVWQRTLFLSEMTEFAIWFIGDKKLLMFFLKALWITLMHDLACFPDFIKLIKLKMFNK